MLAALPILAACGAQEVSEPEPVPVAAIAVTPSVAHLIEGDSLQLQATLLDAQGNELQDRSVQWSSSASQVATVDADGLVRARSAAGTARITATLGAVSGAADVDVTGNAAPVAQIVAPSYAATLPGTSVSLQAVAVDPEDGPLDGAAIDWYSDRDGHLGSGASLTTTLSAGNFPNGVHLLTVRARDSHGKRGSDTLTVRITPGWVLQEFTDQFQQQFGIDAPDPAVMPGNSDGLPINPFGHTAISVVYQGNGPCPYSAFAKDTLGDGCATIYRLYSPGSVAPPRSVVVRRPVGVMRVVVLVVDHGNTNIAGLVSSDWVASQDRINAKHVLFAERLGLSAPIVQFEHTNLLVPAADLPDPADPAAVASYVAAQGISDTAFDILVSLDLDATTQVGGFAVRPDWVHMGCFFSDCGVAHRDFDAAELDAIASAVYDHEIAHLWGWEHAWTTCLYPLGGICMGFITAPQLFGWTDVDGDGIPEILDSSPYGRP